MKRISTDANKWRSSYVGLCGTRVTEPLTFNVSETNDVDKGEK